MTFMGFRYRGVGCFRFLISFVIVVGSIFWIEIQQMDEIRNLLYNTSGQAVIIVRDQDISSKRDAKDFEFLNKRYDVCVVGAGLSGAVIAERYANINRSVLVLEKRPHIGGNCYDYIDRDTGLRVSKYGAHLFHTRHENVWNYVQAFANWTPYQHKVLGLVQHPKHNNYTYVPIPVNIKTVNILFDLNISSQAEMDRWLESEQVRYTNNNTNNTQLQNAEEVALSRVGPRLYGLIFRPYTRKQWDREPRQLAPEVTARIPVRNNWDDRYFSDPWQALPADGYTSMVEAMLAASPTNATSVHTSVDYFDVRDQLQCGRTYYTGPIDTYFAHWGWERLQYRSLSFERRVEYNVDESFYQPAFVVNHPYPEANFTRIVEYKHLPDQPPSNHTVYFVERSTEDGEPYYPGKCRQESCHNVVTFLFGCC